MIPRLNLDWVFRLAMRFAMMNTPVIAVCYFPQLLEQMNRRKAQKNEEHEQLGMGHFEKIQALTKGSEQWRKTLEELPPPSELYSSFPTDKEIEKHGLSVISKEINKSSK